MMASGTRTRCVARESSHGPTRTNAKANGKTTSKRAKQNSRGAMVTGTWVTGRKENAMETESSSLTMDAFSTAANGVKTFSKVRVSSTGPPMILTKVHSSPVSPILHRPRIVKAL